MTSSLRRALIVLAAVVGLLLLRLLEPGPSYRTLTMHGIYDWIGHLLTALIVYEGLVTWRREIPVWAVLTGAVVLDLGHVLTFLGLAEPIAGSSRNGTHSASVVVLLLAVTLVDRPRWSVWIGLGLGAATHLWRDMGTGTVPLLWPWRNEVVSVPFWTYLMGTVAIGLAFMASQAPFRPLSPPSL